jgi:hypothetical protein
MGDFSINQKLQGFRHKDAIRDDFAASQQSGCWQPIAILFNESSDLYSMPFCPL